jgi:hypothetical protein
MRLEEFSAAYHLEESNCNKSQWLRHGVLLAHPSSIPIGHGCLIGIFISNTSTLTVICVYFEY